MQQLSTAAQHGRRAFPGSSRWVLAQQHIITSLLDLIFPPVCVGCGRVDALLCAHCRETFIPPQLPTNTLPPSISEALALGDYTGPLQKAVHALKYDRLTALAAPLGAMLADRIQQTGWPQSLILPIPLHQTRLARRGFNQTALLSQEAAQILGWAWRDDVLLRIRETPTQVGLNYQGRQENVRKAFAINDPAVLADRAVILVDDVLTTGATLGECATTLAAAGVQTIRAVVVGKTILVEK